MSDLSVAASGVRDRARLRPPPYIWAVWLATVHGCALDDPQEATPTFTSDSHAVTEDVIQVPTSGDSFLRPGARNTNEGANPYLSISETGAGRFVVVGFDLSGIALDDVISASLVVTVDDSEPVGNWGPAGEPVAVHRLTEPFTEGNGVNSIVPAGQRYRGDGGGVTWNCANDANIANQAEDCTDPWNGGTYHPTASDSHLHTNGMNGPVLWDVTADVQAGQGAWLIRRTTGSGHVTYYSREGAALAGDDGLGPRLLLEIADVHCDHDGDCGSGVCETGFCVPACESDADCVEPAPLCGPTGHCQAGACEEGAETVSLPFADDFENVALGCFPSPWANANPAAGTTVVGAEAGNHLLEIDDFNVSDFVEPAPIVTFPPVSDRLIIEFDGRVRVGADDLIAGAVSSASFTLADFGIRNGSFHWYDSGVIQTAGPAVIGQWYRFRVELDVITDTYDYYVDDALVAANADFHAPVSDISLFGISSSVHYDLDNVIIREPFNAGGGEACDFDSDCVLGTCDAGLCSGCASDADCADPAPLCGPFGACQAGAEGDACASNLNCATGLSCVDGSCCSANQVWAVTSPLPDTRGQSAAAAGTVSGSHYIYVIGGVTAIQGSRTNTVFYAELDPDTGEVIQPSAVTHGAETWQTTTPYPDNTHNLGAAVYNGRLYVAGGEPGSSQTSADVRYAVINADGTLGAWQDTTDLPQARLAHGFTIENGRLWVLGGSAADFYDDVWFASIDGGGAVGAWSVATTLPSARQLMGVVAVDGFLYSLGGDDGSGGDLDDVDFALIGPAGGEPDLIQADIGAWQANTPFPGPRRAPAVEVGGVLYSIGSTPSVLYSQIRADGSLDAWQTGSAPPSTRTSHALVAHNGRVYLIGGLDPVAGSDYLDTVLLFAPAVCMGTCSDLHDNGEITLDGGSGSAGQSLVDGGWLANGLPGEALSYTADQAFSGSLSMQTVGNNGAGMHTLIEGGSNAFAVEVRYRTQETAADAFVISAPMGGGERQVSIMTAGFCGSSITSFGYRYNNPDGSWAVEGEQIPGAPAYQANTWYLLRIAVDGRDVTVSVSDGITTGFAAFTLGMDLFFDEVNMGVSRCGGGAHTAYWDDFGFTCSDANELLVNGSFDQPISVGWVEVYQEGAVSIDALPDHPTALHLDTVPGGNDYIWYHQDVDVTGVAVETLDFSWDWRVDTIQSPYGYTHIDLGFYDADGNVVGYFKQQRTGGSGIYSCAAQDAEITVPFVCVDDTASFTLGAWSSHTVGLDDLIETFGIAPASVARIQVIMISYNNAGSGADAYFDSVSLRLP